MVISLRQWLRSLFYLLVFVMLAYTLYKAFNFLETFLIPPDKYRIPEGSAVKVFHAGFTGNSQTETLADRLKLFFWYGE